MKNSTFKFVLAFGLLLPFLPEAQGASILKTCAVAGAFSTRLECTIKLKGVIEKDDAEQLRNALLAHPDLYENGELLLDSLGGDVDEAIKISMIMNEWVGRASVAQRGVCAGACFLVWISAPFHGTVSTNLSGVPLIWLSMPHLSMDELKNLPADQIREAKARSALRIREFLSEQNLSQRLVDVMMSRDSHDPYILRRADLVEVKALSPSMQKLSATECGSNPRAHSNVIEANMSISREWWSPVSCINEIVRKRRPAKLEPA